MTICDPRSNNLAKPQNKPPRTKISAASANLGGTVATVQQTRISQGPLPDPELLAHYDQVLPGTAERIVNMAVTQQRHRMEAENRQLDADIRHRDEIHRGSGARQGAPSNSDPLQAGFVLTLQRLM